jgi:hypothetical protein
VGYDSLLVMTGVTDLEVLVAAPPRLRPSYVAADLAALSLPQADVEHTDGRFLSEGWVVEVRDGTLEVSGSGTPDGWWRAVAVAGWAHLDTTGGPVDVSHLQPPAPQGGAE